MCDTVQEHQMEAARKHGVYLVELKPRSITTATVAAICSWSGKRIRVGTREWVEDELRKNGIRVLLRTSDQGCAQEQALRELAQREYVPRQAPIDMNDDEALAWALGADHVTSLLHEILEKGESRKTNRHEGSS